MSIIDSIRRQIARYRDLLANYTRRNKELYYRESTAHAINLSKKPTVENEYTELIDRTFQPMRATSPSFHDLLINQNLDLNKHFLIDDTQNIALIKKIEKVRALDRKFEQEFGISGAWLLGPFLCWKDTIDSSSSSEILISPIFKLAVDIHKDTKKKWMLRLSDSTLVVNPSLIMALKSKCGIHLPDEYPLESPIDVLKEIRNLIESSGRKILDTPIEYDTLPKIPPRFKLIKNEDGEVTDRIPIDLEEALSKRDYELYSRITINDFGIIDVMMVDHLNASRTVLLKDFDSILNTEEPHPILTELFSGKLSSPIQNDKTDKIKEIDGYKERDNYFVINIDSSQHHAINNASKQLVTVIQGPPGTGKSQAITNLIADCMAKGKKILFVSEKRAALDVVYSRLELAKLAGRAILIHSSDLDKKTLYNTFLEATKCHNDIELDEGWEDVSSELDHVKRDLNGYYDILKNKSEPSGLSVAELLTLSSSYPKNETVNIELAKMFSKYPYGVLVKVSDDIDDLQEKVRIVKRYNTHPWLNRKKNTILTNTFKQIFETILANLFENESNIRRLQIELKELIPDGVQYSEIETIHKSLEKIHSDVSLLAFSNYFLSKPNEIANYLNQLKLIESAINKNQKYIHNFNSGQDINTVISLSKYYSISHGILEYFTPYFWEMRALRIRCLKTWDGTNRPFDAFISIHKAVNEYNKLSNMFMGSARKLNSIVEIMHSIKHESTILTEILGLIPKLDLINHTDFISKSESHSEYILLLIEYCNIIKSKRLEAMKNMESIKSEQDKLAQFFDSPPNFDQRHSNQVLYHELESTLSDLSNLDAIDLCIEKIQTKLQSPFDRHMLINMLSETRAQWSNIIKYSVINYWLDELYSIFPDMRNFNEKRFKINLEKFNNLEEKHKILARGVVNNSVTRRWGNGRDENVGIQLLKKESNKQRNILPPRQIMERGALGSMLKLKPCWLMSPLSISQILPLKQDIFDVIIFDEASQVRVEDAIPSIFRASSMVVVGDDKQMPPTNFFASNLPDDDDSIDEFDSDVSDSILDLAAQIYTSEILEWHYRSRSEALIAFSNRAFYGSRLIAPPNPHLLTQGDAIKFNQVKSGFFNLKNGNTAEATEIVDKLQYLLSTNDKKSFGVIAMGQSQMRAIEEAIDKRISEDPVFEELIEKARSYSNQDGPAPLFVKNLENVQGDERDIILISVGYSSSAPDKKLRLSFGPLSIRGGGRRLNVAITRAKERIELFCSFNPDLIPTEEQDFSKNADLVVFGRYLKYAAAISAKNEEQVKKILDTFGVAGTITERKSSGFSKDVGKKLRAIGYDVSEEVGTSRFYIDLAVHHPVIPSNFILGIECDGALFHSTPYARDRDKIRQDLLEARGWKIIRVWSQDWSRDWQQEVSKIDMILKEIISN